MSKIVLSNIASGYDLAKINANFQKIAEELNNKVLYRAPPVGEDNSLSKDIDANGHTIYNLGGISLEGYENIGELVQEVTDSRDITVAAKDAVLAAEDQFTDIFLGSKASDPLVDNDGNALLEGCFYFNTSLSPKRLRVYNGAGWQDVASAINNVVNTIDASLYPSQVEAEAGTNNIKVMTPLRVKESIVSRAATLAQGAKADTSLQPSDVGNTANKLVALDSSAKLPALDGSQLTNLPISPFASAAENAAGTIENKSVDPLGVREAFNASGSAPVFACRAWVKFDGTRNVTDTGVSTNGNPVKIYASGNVSSVTKNAAGDYTVNFNTALPSANYAVAPFFRTTAVANLYVSRSRIAVPTASAFRLDIYNSGIGLQDCEEVYLTFTA